MFSKNLLLLCSLTFLCLLMSNLLQAQSEQLPQTIKKGKLTTTDGYTIEYATMSQKGNQFVFTNRTTGKQESIAKSSVKQIDIQTGNRAGLGAVLGAGLGLVVGITTAARIKADEEELANSGIRVEETDTTPIIIGTTLITGLVGGITGALIKKEKTINLHPSTGNPTSYLQWEGGVKNGLAGISWSIHF